MGCKNSEFPANSENQNSELELESKNQSDYDGNEKEDENREEEGNHKEQVVVGTTPEETIKLFFDAVSKKDVETMMACCYVDDYLDRVSFEDYIDLFQTASLTTNNGIAGPAEYEYYRELAVYEREAYFAKSFRVLAYSLLAPYEEYQDYYSGLVIAPVDKIWASAFVSRVEPERLVNLKVLSIDDNSSELQDDPKVLERLSRNFMADGCTECSVLLELDGVLFGKGFTLVEINGQWQIGAMNAIILGESPNGAATQFENIEEYKDWIE